MFYAWAGLFALVESPHDLAEDNPERVGWRLVVLGKPAAACPWIGPCEFGKEELRFIGPSEPR
jgi:hypothetical protein